MRTHRHFALLALVAAASVGRIEAQTIADTLNSALLWRDSTSFFVTPPRGWVLDSEVGKRDGVLAALFRQGESWRSGHVVMYANTLTLGATSDVAFRSALDAAAREWTAAAGDASISEQPSVTAADGSVAVVKRFTSVRNGAFELVAYFHNEATAAVLVMTSRSASELDRAIPDFLRFAQSYGKGPRVRRGPGTG